MKQSDAQEMIYDLLDIKSRLDNIKGIPYEIDIKLQKIIKNLDKFKNAPNILPRY